jgi:hypothetical protein
LSSEALDKEDLDLINRFLASLKEGTSVQGIIFYKTK